MTRWNLVLRNGVNAPIDASNLRRERLSELGDRALNEICLEYNGERVALGELFSCHASASENHTVVVEGDLRKVHGLAAAHDCGEFRIEGDTGDGVGASMTGGTVIVQGSVGDRVGGPLGSRKTGMSGGKLMVSGNCGADLGHRMRRGTIIIACNAGDGAAVAMIAGTICIGGQSGDALGVAMRRGTVLLAEPREEFREPATTADASRFSHPVSFDPGFLALFSDPKIRSIAQHLRNVGAKRVRADRTIGGIGEIVFPG